MATPIFLPSSGAADIDPTAKTTGWEQSSINTDLMAVLTKGATAMTTVSFNDTDDTNDDILFRTWVLDAALAAQTIAAQTVKLVMRCSETSSNNNLFLAWRIYVVSADGSVARGYIVGTSTTPRRDGTEAATSLTSRADSLTSSAVDAQDGDRLVIQVGMAGDPNASEDHDSSIRVGDAAASALTEGNTDTDDDYPWVEFADTLTFAAVASGQPTSKRFGGVPFFGDRGPLTPGIQRWTRRESGLFARAQCERRVVRG